jgi:predicted house-cleaning noncanonical NTP pyrophosphatase (MazG superfamily)
LADFAKQHGIIIELYGGILSHAFYMLNTRGARVECVDLFGEYEDTVEFDKLVRDEVPDVIISRGERAATIKLGGDALILALKRKLVEEAFEALDTNSGAALLEELADIVEVVRAVAIELGVSHAQVETVRKSKARKRGAFREGMMLVSTHSPGSLARRKTGDPGSFLIPDKSPRVISDPSQLPVRPLRRRPDLRQTSAGEREKLLALDFELPGLREAREELDLGFSEEGQTAPLYRMTVELRRDRGTLRVVCRVRQRVLQLDFLDSLER